jgi:hypothetical protein
MAKKEDQIDCDVCQNKRWLYGNSWRDENRKDDLPKKYKNVSFVRLPCPKCSWSEEVKKRIAYIKEFTEKIKS